MRWKLIEIKDELDKRITQISTRSSDKVKMCLKSHLAYLGSVCKSKNISPARLTSGVTFKHCLYRDFHALSKRWGKSVDVINLQRIINNPLKRGLIYFPKIAVLYLYGKTSPGWDFVSERWSLTIPVVWSEDSFSIQMQTQISMVF